MAVLDSFFRGGIQRRIIGAAALSAVLALALWLELHAIKNQTCWTMINVAPGQNQADCHLIEFPNGAKVLVDIADASDAPGMALAFLKKRKIKHIDLVVISHFHRDHYGRLVDLIKAGVKIDRVAINLPASREQMDHEHEGTPLADWDDVQATLQFLREKRIPCFTPKEGERLIDASTAGIPVYLDVVCLYDGIHTPVGPTDINDTSIILRLSHGPTRALFTGDLNYPLGMWLAHSNFDLGADLLKVPHHGTEGCAPNEFFLRVNPKAVLVPSPKALWFSLRSKRIHDFFSEHRIPAYVSGINGNITVVMTMHGFTIQPEHPGP